MICIPVLAKSNAEARAMLELAAREPADLHELRLDGIGDAPDVEGLVSASGRPVLATCRSAAQGGFFAGTADERLALLQRAADTGAAYVDAEEDVVRRLRRRRDFVVIASWHDFSRVPEDMRGIAARLAGTPCDWVKFAAAANRPADNLKILDAVRTCPKPAVGIAMGEIGLPSRILGPAFGSRITFGGLGEGFESAPGQPTAGDLARVFRVKALTRQTAVYGLIGDPVRHSIGYRIHNQAFAAAGLDAVYIPFHCPDAGDFFATLPENLNLRGLSVTMPHKGAALAWAGFREESAAAVGAANTLTRRPGGWTADNTDFHAVVEAVGGAASAHDVDLRKKPVLVLGTGGAARAAGAALDALGCATHVSGRDPAKTNRLAAEKRWTAVPWPEKANGEWAVVANATSLGMRPGEAETPFPAAGWKSGMIAFESVYRPRATRFLREAELAGAWTVDGLDMFVRQAARQFTLWTGLEFPEETRSRFLEQDLC